LKLLGSQVLTGLTDGIDDRQWIAVANSAITFNKSWKTWLAQQGGFFSSYPHAVSVLRFNMARTEWIWGANRPVMDMSLTGDQQNILPHSSH
jgi:hypothetical protein